MPNYRRVKSDGGTFFFTVVTYRRQKFLTRSDCRRALRNAITEVKQDHPFHIDAWVLLSDHMHCIWTMQKNDADFSKRWGLIKAGFSKQVKDLLHREALMSPSKRKHRESSIWQRRFWEHAIRDDEDFARHVDYIHYNPVKHGYVDRVCDWPYSTFHRYVRCGVYLMAWAGVVDDTEGNKYGE